MCIHTAARPMQSQQKRQSRVWYTACCSVLQCVAACCNTQHKSDELSHLLQCGIRCSMVQCVAVCFCTFVRSINMYTLVYKFMYILIESSAANTELTENTKERVLYIFIYMHTQDCKFMDCKFRNVNSYMCVYKIQHSKRKANKKDESVCTF